MSTTTVTVEITPNGDHCGSCRFLDYDHGAAMVRRGHAHCRLLDIELQMPRYPAARNGVHRAVLCLAKAPPAQPTAAISDVCQACHGSGEGEDGWPICPKCKGSGVQP